jgi:hypothetical protein
MAVAASLSAFSFWQATRFADEDAGLRERARVATTEAARDERELQALVDFDLDLSTSYCAASTERDAALLDLIEAPLDEARPATDALVTQRLRAGSLWNLLQADWPATPCAGSDQPSADSYSVDSAREWRVAGDPTFGSAGAPVASGERTSAAQGERLLMYAAVAFAGALLLLTAANLATPRDTGGGGSRPDRRGRWARMWYVLAWCALGVGAVLMVGEAPLVETTSWVAATLAALALAFAVVTVVGRRRSSTRAGGHSIRWWAELVGGLTLVALALAALELSVVAGRQRATRAEADRLSATAERMLEDGEQSALHDLATVAELAELDAREAAANQVAASSGLADRIGAAHESAETHAATVERLPSTRTRPEAGPDDVAAMCPTTTRPAATYDALLTASRTDPLALSAHVAAEREDGTACTVQAALSRSEADAWAERAATVTVALVTLGLGGFLLALAADPDRTPAPARWLLSLGIVGVAAGGLLALSVVAASALDGDRPGSRSRLAFARHVAAGETALSEGDCGSAVAELDEALDIHRRHAPAYTARMNARACTVDDDWLIAPSLSEDRVAGALADATRAAELGTPEASDLGDIAWLRVLGALGDARPAEAEVARAAESAAEAVDAAIASESPGIHVARFNLALVLLATGDGNAGPAYEEALRCLDSAASCPGGGIGSGELRTYYRLMALDDLELLGDLVPRPVADRYRLLIVTSDGLDDRGATTPGPGWTATAFPQELQVSSADGSDRVSVVWYYRTGPADSWDVVIDPSVRTVVPDWHANHPISTSRPLPAGSYRADVYVDGRITRAETEFDGTGSYERVVAPGLGFSAVVPSDWEAAVRIPGVDTAVGPPGVPDALVFGRIEGERPDPDADVEDWLDATLDDWVGDQLGTDALDGAGPNDEDGAPYVVGLGHERERWYPEVGVWAGIGVSPYIDDPYCGGALFVMLIRADGTDVPLKVQDSIVLDWAETDQVVALTGPVALDGRSIELPAGWVGVEGTQAETDSLLAAQECRSGAGLEIDTEEVTEDELTGADPLTDLVDARVEGLIAGIDGLTLAGRDDTRLAGGDPAVDVTLTTTLDGFTIEHRVLYVLDGTTLTTLSFTVPGEGDYDDVVDQAFDSFALT